MLALRPALIRGSIVVVLIWRYSEKFDSGMALMQMDFSPERMAKLFNRWNGPLAGQPALQRHFKRESAG